ncbi:MAG TPA: UDP-3-O-(3-hydroxymyristoyl)glucosamine N-acyltransferase [Saprospiraceae bacterium]|nr:UDP-3-O-(3-hydroxymyristoyl)glucosamine N-acyltransferase [Saprospiraceae bacterium]
MQLKALQIAQLIKGTVDGDPNVLISAPSKIDETYPQTITFFANPKFEEHLYQTQAAAIIIPKDFEPKAPITATLIRVEDVYSAVAFLFDHFSRKAMPEMTISPQSVIHPDANIGKEIGVGHFSVIEKNATIGNQTAIGTNVYIGEGVKIGKNVLIYSGVKIYHSCEIGDNCIIHANAVIGSDGFGFAPQEDGTYKKIHQLGIVIVEDDVEIGANTTIDRGTMGPTVIKKGVKLDNLIQIAHNVEVGENTVIAAQSGIAGSAKLGKNIRIGGQVAIVGHISIADGTQFQGKTGVGSSITKENSAWWGIPAIPYMEYMRAYIKFKDLPNIESRLRLLEKKLEEANNNPEPKI